MKKLTDATEMKFQVSAEIQTVIHAKNKQNVQSRHQCKRRKGQGKK